MPEKKGRKLGLINPKFASVSHLALSRLDPFELRMYVAIRLHANLNPHRCFPTNRRLGDLLEVTARYVQMLMERIRKKGGLIRTFYNGMWRFYFPWEDEAIPADAVDEKAVIVFSKRCKG